MGVGAKPTFDVASTNAKHGEVAVFGAAACAVGFEDLAPVLRVGVAEENNHVGSFGRQLNAGVRNFAPLALARGAAELTGDQLRLTTPAAFQPQQQRAVGAAFNGITYFHPSISR